MESLVCSPLQLWSLLTYFLASVTLFVPCSRKAGSDQLLVLDSADWEDTKLLMYDTIGCRDADGTLVVNLPEMTYKMEGAAVRTIAYNLDSQAAWIGLIKQVRKTAEKKRGVRPGVVIYISELVS